MIRTTAAVVEFPFAVPTCKITFMGSVRQATLNVTLSNGEATAPQPHVVLFSPTLKSGSSPPDNVLLGWRFAI